MLLGLAYFGNSPLKKTEFELHRLIFSSITARELIPKRITPKENETPVLIVAPNSQLNKLDLANSMYTFGNPSKDDVHNIVHQFRGVSRG